LYQFSIPLKTTACMLFLLFQQALVKQSPDVAIANLYHYFH
jgi:hypothetical protein